MKRKSGLQFVFFACFAALLFDGGCVSMVESAGRRLDGSASADKIITVYRAEKKKGAVRDMEIREVQNKAGLRSIIIMLDQYPSIKLRGSFPGDNGEFFLTSLDYLAGSFHGWNEFRLDLFGTGSLILNNNAAVFLVPGTVEKVQISSGRIRSYDTRITGNDALGKLRDRQERINALAEWMEKREGAPKGLDRDDFEDYWKPVLFPEMVSKKKQPEEWKQENDQFNKAENIRWNTGYSERIFPEMLRDVRNSGTMLRDWEEALPWIYIEYEWERIMELLKQEITLFKR